MASALLWQARIYLSMVSSLDDGMGQLVATLKQESMLANTILVFM